MLGSLGRFVVAHARIVLVVALVVAIGAAVYGSRVARSLTPGGFEVAGGEATEVADIVSARFGVGDPDLVAVVTARDGATMSEAHVRAEVDTLAAELRARADVTSVSAPRWYPNDPLVSVDGRTAMLAISLQGSALDKEVAYPNLAAALAIAEDDLDIDVGGPVALNSEAQTLAEDDLTRAELVAFPVMACLLLAFFGGRLLAAALPLVVGAFAIALSTAILRLLTHVTDISVFALNVVTLLGLGLAIDYSLFMVQRFREELAVAEPAVAAARTISSAGKTMLYSGIAVATSLLGLLVFPVALLHSIAIGGVVVVGLSMLASILVLPALLAALGRRVEWPRRARVVNTPRVGWWARLAQWVMRRPALIATVTAAVLLVMGVPFLRFSPALSDARIFPPDSEVRAVQERLDDDDGFAMDGNVRYDLVLVADGPIVDNPDVHAELATLHEELTALDFVVAVQGPGNPAMLAGATLDAAAAAAWISGDSARMIVVADEPADAAARREHIDQIRRLAEGRFSASVGGRPKVEAELDRALARGLLPAASIVVAVTLIVLTLAFGAIVVAFKAVLMNALSLMASFGALVFVFQDGRFEGLLHYGATGHIDPLVPIIMFAIVFGLSMDYELFLLSRIRETYDATHDADGAVATGLAKTGRIITMAGAMLVVVLLGFAVGRILFVKQLGLGMAVAVLVDATIVRALLVPSTMALLGRYNWVSPAWFSRWWHRTGIGVREHDPVPDARL